MSDRFDCKLGDVVEMITKGTTPSTIGGSILSSGINFIKSEAVSYSGRIDRNTFVFIDQKTHDKLRRSQLKKDDILFSMAGIFLGKTGLVTEDILPANTNQALAIIRLDQQKASPKFIHYYLRQNTVIDYVNTISGQSAQPNINFEEIRSIDILLAPLPEQQSIAEVLSSLDDKIDLLHRQNKTLEQLAETLFRQWFVEEAEDEREEIRLTDVASHVKKSVNPAADPSVMFHHYSLPAFDNGCSPEYQLGAEILSNKFSVASGQILISKLNPRTPRVWYLHSVDRNSVCSTEFLVYEPKKEVFSEFIYGFLSSRITKDTLSGAASGTSGSHQRVNADDVNALSIKRPIDETLLKFHDHASTWLSKIDANRRQISILQKTRDTLLPKLMSGSVRVIE